MARRKPEGMLMSPSNGGGSTPTGGGVRGPNEKRPSGQAHPAVSGGEGGGPKDPKECNVEPNKPMEVAFTQQTFRKLIAWTFGPLLVVLVGGLSAFFYFYHKTNSHIGDPTIHLTRGERISLETKAEAREERKKIKKDIITHFDVKVREIKVEQKEQMTKIVKSLEEEQKSQYYKLLKEIKKAN